LNGTQSIKIILFLEGISRRHRTRKAIALRVFYWCCRRVINRAKITEKNEKSSGAEASAAFFMPVKWQRTANALAKKQDQDNDKDDGADTDIHSDVLFCC
jgi:hypothetical protein